MYKTYIEKKIQKKWNNGILLIYKKGYKRNYNNYMGITLSSIREKYLREQLKKDSQQIIKLKK